MTTQTTPKDGAIRLVRFGKRMLTQEWSERIHKWVDVEVKDYDESKTTPENIRNYTFDQLLEAIICYQYQTGVDPAVGDVFEAVGEALRRIWEDRNAR